MLGASDYRGPCCTTHHNLDIGASSWGDKGYESPSSAWIWKAFLPDRRSFLSIENDTTDPFPDMRLGPSFAGHLSRIVYSCGNGPGRSRLQASINPRIDRVEQIRNSAESPSEIAAFE